MVKNYLTDKFFDKLLEKPLDVTQAIDLGSNCIKLAATKSLIGKSFASLKELDLSNNEISDETVEILAQAYFPKLEVLVLSGNDIGLQGFIKLLNLNAP